MNTFIPKRNITEFSKANVKYFMDFAMLTSEQSKYDGRKVGCVIVTEKGDIAAHGCNGYPRGINDLEVNKLSRDERLLMAIHAEENAMSRLNSLHTDVSEYFVFITHFPCIKCAGRLYSKGFRKIVYQNEMKDWTDNVKHLYPFLKDMEFIHYNN